MFDVAGVLILTKRTLRRSTETCLAMILVAGFCCSCQSPTETECRMRRVTVHGLILPGRVDHGEAVQAKFIWQGGGMLHELSHVSVDREFNRIIIVPMGKWPARSVMPLPIFKGIETVSLGILDDGQYKLAVLGDTVSYFGSLAVPSTAPESLFQFEIKTVYPGTTIPKTGVTIDVGLLPPADTILVGATDSSGVLLLNHPPVGVDTLSYRLILRPEIGSLGRTQIRLGTPEVITLGAP